MSEGSAPSGASLHHGEHHGGSPDACGPDAAAPRRIYLARHGRTALNARGVLRGRLDPSLDAVGRDEVLRLARAMAGVRARRVVTSPLARALQTARAIASAGGAGIEIDQRLVDRDYGRWAGMARPDVVRRFGSLDDAPGVEPLEQVRARVRDAFADVSARADGDTAIVVSHDIVIRVLLLSIDPGLGHLDAIPQETGCYNVLERNGGEWIVASLNQVPPGAAPIEGASG